MIIEEFCSVHADGRKIEHIDSLMSDWALHAQIEEFLAVPVMEGVLLGDWLSGKRIADIDVAELDRKVPDAAREGFASLTGDKVDSVEKIRELIIDKYRGSEASLRGLMNKIQGQIGEDRFVEASGGLARLAKSGSQEGWDVAWDSGDETRYIQVKVYADADGVVKHMEAVNDKISRGAILGEDAQTAIDQIEFAVNSDIVEEVRSKAEALGFDNPVQDLGESREQIRSWLKSAQDQSLHPPLEGFFGDILKHTAQSAAVIAATNAFFVWYGCKERSRAIEDTAYATIIAAGGISAAHAVSRIAATPLGLKFAILGGPIAGVLAMIVATSVRSVLRRISDRRHVARRIADGNDQLRALCDDMLAFPQTMYQP